MIVACPRQHPITTHHPPHSHPARVLTSASARTVPAGCGRDDLTSKTFSEEFVSSTEKTNTRSMKRSCNVPQELLPQKKPPPESNPLRPQHLTVTLLLLVGLLWADGYLYWPPDALCLAILGFALCLMFSPFRKKRQKQQTQDVDW